MSGRIVLMAEELSSKIAAGEVIERPASIVKELVENSIDAGADDIRVELERGGKTSIRIIDNGEGMDYDDAARAFERYATSKIRKFDDIYGIQTYGFRGEALPSIASISKFEMLTRRKDAESGTRVLIEGGTKKEIIEAGCPAGTSMFVYDIFFSTPVRKKFLKKESTEQAHCIDAVVRLALAHPHVKVTVHNERRAVLMLPKCTGYSERISYLFGSDFTKQSISVENTMDDIKLWGLISRPLYTRSNTKGIFYYVNGRYIRDSFLNNAVMTPYRRLIEAKRFPSAVLFLSVPPADTDINVHPAKMEVRFKNPGEVHKLIVSTLSSALLHNAGPSGSTSEYSSDRASSISDRYKSGVRDSLKRYTILSQERKLVYTGHRAEDSMDELLKSVEKNNHDEPISVDGKWTFSSLDYITHIGGTYLVFRDRDGFILIDQHAAHERVLFEKLREMYAEKNNESQLLLIPEILDLSPADFTLIMDYRDLLDDLGFKIETYGANTIIVRSVPSLFAKNDTGALISDIIEEVEKTGKARNLEEMKNNILTLVACKSAVKAHHMLTKSEAENLCHDLDTIPFASTCPHGRPIFIKFTLRDLEKMFKRR